MSHRCDRRTFLRRLGRAGVVAPFVPLGACGEGRVGAGEASRLDGPAGRASERPILVPWGADAVRVVTPLVELPMAYVSTSRREVYVDFEYRNRSNWVLDAHISVSTGVWRIPLPGDPPRQPITPGDTIREFEELDIAEWDPSMEPAEGDFRIRRGTPAEVRLELTCVPVPSTGDWMSGGPWTIRQCVAEGESACREDFVEVGVGTRRRLRGCEGEGEPARFFAWVSER